MYILLQHTRNTQKPFLCPSALKHVALAGKKGNGSNQPDEYVRLFVYIFAFKMLTNRPGNQPVRSLLVQERRCRSTSLSSETGVRKDGSQHVWRVGDDGRSEWGIERDVSFYFYHQQNGNGFTLKGLKNHRRAEIQKVECENAWACATCFILFKLLNLLLMPSILQSENETSRNAFQWDTRNK